MPVDTRSKATAATTTSTPASVTTPTTTTAPSGPPSDTADSNSASSASGSDSGSHASTMASVVGQLTPFDERVETISTFLLRVKHYIIANKVADNLKVSVLLTVLGPKIVTVLEDLVAPTEVDSKTYDELIATLKDHYKPTTLTVVERYKFNSRMQLANESIADYVVQLKHMASTCNFGNFLKDALRDRLVSGLRDDSIRQRLLTDEQDFEGSLKKALTLEEAIRQKNSFGTPMERGPSSGGVNKIRAAPNKNKPKSDSTSKTPTSHHSSNKETSKKPCYRCGSDQHVQFKCPFKDYKCNGCGALGHLHKVCKKDKREGKVKLITDTDNSDGRNFLFRIGSSAGGPIMIDLLVEGKKIPFEVDTGTYYSIVSHSLYLQHFSSCALRPSNVELSAVWFDQNLPLRGVTKVNVRHGGVTHQLDLYVLEEGARPIPTLLGRQWNTVLQIVEVKNSTVQSVQRVDTDLVSKIKEKFSTVFDGKPGRIKGFEASLVLKEGAVPIFCKARNIPFALRPAVDKELDRLEQDKIITKVKHAAYATPLVVVPKKDGVRVCADFKVTLNRVLEREHYPLPVIQDIFAEMAGSKFYSILDLTGAYLQLPVREDCAHLLTVNTPRGLYRYNFLPFGLASSPSIFQSCMDEILKDVKGVRVYIDDVIVWGASEKEMIARLEAVLTLLSKHNIKVNLSKCKFSQRKVEYLGFVVSEHGLQPTEDLVKSIKEAPAPANKAELQSYLGLLNIYHDYIPNASGRLASLYELTRNDVEWDWTEERAKLFEESKAWVCQDNVLAFYDPQQPIRLTTDASGKGVGAVLSHVVHGKDRPISFASKVLLSSETNYSQIEREALAIVFGIKKFHKFLYGRHFELVCDNKPLTLIFGEKKAIPAMAAARLQRWAILLAAYDYTIVHKRGTEICNADFLSRCAIPDTDPVESDFNSFSSVKHLETVLQGVDSGAEEEALTAVDIARETQKDAVLSQVYNFLRFGWPSTIEDNRLDAYAKKRDELSTDGECILWGARVVVPETLQHRVLKLLHGGHPGIVKMKMLARSFVWWPKMDEHQEFFVRNCESCQQSRPAAAKGPLHHWPVPARRWQRLHIDFAETRQQGQPHYMLLVVDAYSKWLEVFLMKSTTTEKTVELLRRLFATYGLPEEVVSDNGPQFKSSEFAQFMKMNKIKHVTSPPYHPQSNGAIERCVQTTKQSIWKQVFDSRGTSLQHKLDSFLFHYRNTPHMTTQKTPAEVFLGWMPRTHLTLLKPSLAQFVEQRHRAVEEKVNLRRQDPVIADQDLVWVKSRRGESSNWLPGQVLAQKSPLTFRVSTGGPTELVHADHLRPRQNLLPNVQGPASPQRSPVKESTTPVAASPPSAPRRTGRVRQPPVRLQL